MLFHRLTLPLLWTYAGLVFLSLLLALLGQFIPSILTPLSTAACFAFAVLHAGQKLGWKRVLLFLAVSFSVSLIFESVGVATGYVYGPYHYTNSLGLKIFGLVPLLIPLAWFMMLYPSLAMAELLLPDCWNKGRTRRLASAALGGVIMTAWDFSLDPLMAVLNHWVWDVKGVYFGIPLLNFWGWWLTAFVIFWLYQQLSLGIKTPRLAPFLSDGYLVTVYLLTAGGSVIINSVYHQGGPALVGLFVIFPWVAAGYFKVVERTGTYVRES